MGCRSDSPVTRMHRYDGCRFDGPGELAEALADDVDAHWDVAASQVETIRTSSTPMQEPFLNNWGSSVSMSEMIRIELINAVEQQLDSVYVSGRGGPGAASYFSVTTHPELLEQTTRLLPKPAIALAYQFGYVPSGFRKVEEAGMQDDADFPADVPWEFRVFSMEYDTTYLYSDAASNYIWFDDADAVTEFADYATTGDIDWGKYTEWFYTTPIPAFRVDYEATARDWTDLPPPIPEQNPTIKPRFLSPRDPSLGALIRYSILKQLETALPSVSVVNTGPTPWHLDRISLVVEPTFRGDGLDTAGLCPPTALVKLARLGYRPIDGWFDAPIQGFKRDDPVLPRHIEFARGDALEEWILQTLAGTAGIDVAAELHRHVTGDFEWEPYVRCLQSTIVTNHDLWRRARSAQRR